MTVHGDSRLSTPPRPRSSHARRVLDRRCAGQHQARQFPHQSRQRDEQHRAGDGSGDLGMVHGRSSLPTSMPEAVRSFATREGRHGIAPPSATVRSASWPTSPTGAGCLRRTPISPRPWGGRRGWSASSWWSSTSPPPTAPSARLRLARVSTAHPYSANTLVSTHDGSAMPRCALAWQRAHRESKLRIARLSASDIHREAWEGLSRRKSARRLHRAAAGPPHPFLNRCSF